MSAARDPMQELQDLLEAITRGVTGNQSVGVYAAKGRGFVHFEIRCSPDAHARLRKVHESLRLLMLVAGTVRKTRITLQFHEQALAAAAHSDLIPKPSEQLENLVLTMSRSLADRPEDVVVFAADGEGFSHYDVRCDRDDVGSLLGSRAAHVNAMRALLTSAGDALGMRATIQVMARDGND